MVRLAEPEAAVTESDLGQRRATATVHVASVLHNECVTKVRIRPTLLVVRSGDAKERNLSNKEATWHVRRNPQVYLQTSTVVKELVLLALKGGQR